METLLIFLAIAVIQMIAAYSKQKKEAAKKEAQKYTPPPEATEPIPDPFRNLRESIGFPAREEPVFESILKQKPTLELEPEPVRAQRARPVSVAASPVSRGTINRAPTKFLQIDLKNPAQGILWAAILQEPRYKVKWKPR